MVTISFGGTSATPAAHQPTPIRNGEEPDSSIRTGVSHLVQLFQVVERISNRVFDLDFSEREKTLFRDFDFDMRTLTSDSQEYRQRNRHGTGFFSLGLA